MGLTSMCLVGEPVSVHFVPKFQKWQAFAWEILILSVENLFPIILSLRKSCILGEEKNRASQLFHAVSLHVFCFRSIPLYLVPGHSDTETFWVSARPVCSFWIISTLQTGRQVFLRPSLLVTVTTSSLSFPPLPSPSLLRNLLPFYLYWWSFHVLFN